jgi:glycosyltransferase involved in cell wall biosynthesis
MKIMIWNAARGGMRSVVLNYVDDGFVASQGVKLIHSYADLNLAGRQILLGKALIGFIICLATRKVELVHCHAAMRGSFWRKSLFAIVARRFGIPVLLHLHGSEMRSFYEGQSARVRRAITRQLEMASRVIVLSESWKEFVLAIAPQAKPVIVPNYVRMPANVEKHAGKEITVLFLGLLGKRKGIFDLLKAFAQAHRQIPSLRLLVGGNGQVEEAKRIAEDLGIVASVEFLGWVDEARRLEMLMKADIFALPSYNEGLPMSVLEAMAHGIPVITTPVGGIPEVIIDGVHGRLVAPGDITAIETALLEFAGQPELRRRIGEAGRCHVGAKYADGVVLPLLHSIYDETKAPNTLGKNSKLRLRYSD